MKNYIRKVNYHETDKMQVTHHSNYIKFMEEARVFFLEQIGYSFQRMESEGLVSPVVSVEVAFKRPTTFADEIEIEVAVKELTAVKMVFEYTMRCKNEVVCLASSTHCFVDENGKPIIIKKTRPELYTLLESYLNK